jgi:hypothetical protein
MYFHLKKLKNNYYYIYKNTLEDNDDVMQVCLYVMKRATVWD